MGSTFKNFWSEECILATQQSLPNLLVKLYASYGSVIAAFSATTVLAAALLIRIRFTSHRVRKSMWRFLVVFICLLLFGSLGGIIAWSFRILIREEDYAAIKIKDKALAQEIISRKYRVQGGWFGFYGVQFFCLSLAKLILLDHFTELGILSFALHKRRFLRLLKQGVFVFVILCNLIGLIAFLYAAFAILQLSFNRLELSNMIRRNASALDVASYGAAIDQDYTAKVSVSISVQFCFEAAVLLLILSCYFIVLVIVLKLVRAASDAAQTVHLISVNLALQYQSKVGNLADQHAAMASKLKRRMVVTVIVTFCGVLISAGSAILFAFANLGYEYNNNAECGGTFPTGQCLPCQPTGQLVKSWLRFTPEFHAVIVLIGSPATLTVALWGMLSRKDRRLLTSRFNFRVLPPTENTDAM